MRYLLAAYKQRGKSLAFCDRSVVELRTRLGALHGEREEVEAEARGPPHN